MGAGDDHVDVGLDAVNDGVQVATALGLLHVDYDSLSNIGAGSHIVAGHAALQVVNVSSGDVLLNHTEVVSGIGYGSVGSVGSLTAGGAGIHENNIELRNALVGSVVAGDVESTGNADGVIGAVSTHVVLGAVHFNGEHAGFLVISPNLRGGGGHLGTRLAVAVEICFDVGLGLAVHVVETVAVAFLLNINRSCSCCILGGGPVFTGQTTGQVQSLAQVTLNHHHVVGLALFQLSHFSAGDIGINRRIHGSVGGLAAFGAAGTAGGGGVQVGHIGIGDLAFGSSTDSHIGAVGAHVVDSTVHGGVQGVQLGVVSKDGLVAGGIGEVHVGAVSNNVNILLGRAVHEVQVVTALSGLQVNINALGEIGVGSAVVGAHSAGEVVSSFLGGLVQTQLVSNADLGSGGISTVSQCGSIVSGNIRCQHELGLVLGLRRALQVADPGSGDGLEVTVSAQEVLAGLHLGNIDALGGVVSPDAGNGSAHSYTAAGLALGVEVVFHTNVGLGLAIHVVEADALAGDALHKDVNAFRAQGRGVQSVAVAIAGEVQSLLQSLLLDIQSVSGLFLQRTVVHITGTLGPADHLALGAKLQLTVVVLDDTGDSDGIGLADLIDAVADHTVALDLLAAHQDGDGDVAVAGIVGRIHAVDLAGQSCDVGQLLTGVQLAGIGQDLVLVRGGAFSHAAAADAVDHLTACVELDGALVVLDNAGDSNQVLDGDLAHINALHTVAQDGVLGIAFDLNDNGDVAVVGIVGAVDLDNSTGQSSGVGQLGVFLQGVCSLQDLAGIGDSFNSFAFFHSVQSTTGVKLDGAVVVLQSAGDSDDVADQQLVNAFALQAVAHNGLALSAFHFDGNSDVLVLSGVNGVDGSDLAAQGGLVGQAFAGSQFVSGIDDLNHIHGGRQDHIPGVGCGVAKFVGNSSGQGVGSGHFAQLVHIDGDGAVFVHDDLDQIFAHIHGPNHGEGDAGDTDDAVAVIVHGGGGGLFGVLINGTKIFHCLFGSGTLGDKIGAVHRRLCGRCGGFVRSLLATAAGQHADNQDENENPC